MLTITDNDFQLILEKVNVESHPIYNDDGVKIGTRYTITGTNPTPTE